METKSRAKIKKWMLAVLLCAISALAAGCFLGSSKAPVLTCDTFELTVGKTTAGELLDAGFTSVYALSMADTIDSMSWENIYSIKGDLRYGTMRAGNKTSSSIDIEKGVIFEVVLTYNKPDEPMGAVLVNGVNYEGYSRDQIKETMEGQEITLDSEKYLVYEIGKYKYSFRFEEGADRVVGITINDGTETELIIK